MISQPTDALVLHTSPHKRVAQLSSMYLYTYSSFSPKCCPSPIRAACLQQTRTTNSSRSETYSFWCQMLHVFILLMQPMCGTVNNDHTANDEDNKNDNNNLCIFFRGRRHCVLSDCFTTCSFWKSTCLCYKWTLSVSRALFPMSEWWVSLVTHCSPLSHSPLLSWIDSIMRVLFCPNKTTL